MSFSLFLHVARTARARAAPVLIPGPPALPAGAQALQLIGASGAANGSCRLALESVLWLSRLEAARWRLADNKKRTE